MLSLNNKRVILGITGGIAAYKSAELCRLLKGAGVDVRVVMTRAAREFITPLTLQALSGNRVREDLLDTESEAAMGHIELARWADLILVAPASANFLARLAAGAADDLLSTLCLAADCPIALAPAMNQAMWAKPQTASNLETLRARGAHVFGPASGEQACGDVGPGRMLEAAELAKSAAALFETGILAGLKVTLSAGPTREAIDPVRFLSNHSSGKMGYALAQAAMEAGAAVTLVSGPVCLPPPPRVEVVRVQSAGQMLEACMATAPDVFIGVAAVADYRPESALGSKLKKTEESLQLTLVKNPDILARMAARPDRPFCVGFAAETEDLVANARGKLASKGADLILANDAAATFDHEEAALTAIWTDGERELALAAKTRQAREIIGLIGERLGK